MLTVGVVLFIGEGTGEGVIVVIAETRGSTANECVDNAVNILEYAFSLPYKK